MNTSIQATLSPSTTAHNAPALGGAIGLLRAFMQRTGAWLQARKRIVEDRRALANMSERELADIGLGRGSIDAAAQGMWTRDYPR